MIVLNSLITFNLFIIAILLFFRKNNALPNKILALIFLIPGLNFANNILILLETIYVFPFSYFIVQGTAVLFAPLVYYYILLLIGKKMSYAKMLFYVSGLLFCFNATLAIDFAFQSKIYQNEYLNAVLNGPYPIEMEIYSLLFFVLQLVYFTLGAKDIYLYGKKSKNTLSDLQGTKFTYLKRFISLLWLLTFVTIILYASFETVKVEYIFLPLVVSAIYVFILYYAFHHHAIFTAETFNIQLIKGNDIESHLSENGMESKQKFPQELPEKILYHINQNFIYKDKEIILQKLAHQLDYPAFQVSKAINQGLNTNFYDLINKKRVDEAKKLLEELQKHNLSIEGVAYEVGFNSRTAFYRAFKKYTDKNPTEFLEKTF